MLFLPPPSIVGLDLSLTAAGIAVLTESGLTVEHVGSKPKKGDPKGELVLLGRMRRQVAAVMSRIPKGAAVGIEGPSFASTGTAAHMLGGLWWMTLNALESAGHTVIVIPPSSRATYAAGVGNASKLTVMAAAIRRYDGQVEIRDDNEADAVVLAAMVARAAGYPLEASLPQSHKRAMEKVVWPAAWNV
jgi:crossover junction endodeoxyribonuclease RuvC